MTVKCTRITDQRVGWVDRWIQVNRFTRPHVPCISAGCEVKSSGMKFKVLKGRNLQELAPLSFQIYETGLLHRSLNLLAADISNCFHFSNYLSSYLEKKEKKNIEKSSRMSESESCYPYFNRERKGGGGRIKIMDKTTSPFFHKRKKKQNGSRILQRIPPPRF